MNNHEKLFLYLAIASAIFLLYGLTLYLLREKLSRRRKQPSNINPKLIENTKHTISLLKIFLWSSPVYLIFVPWIFYKYLDTNGFIAFVSMALVIANTVILYINQKWYYQYLRELDKSSQSSPSIPGQT
jgi:hypothetical protein